MHYKRRHKKSKWRPGPFDSLVHERAEGFVGINLYFALSVAAPALASRTRKYSMKAVSSHRHSKGSGGAGVAKGV
jgi:hypothetical protein